MRNAEWAVILHGCSTLLMLRMLRTCPASIVTNRCLPGPATNKPMPEIPVFNPQVLYPVLGTLMPRSRIEDDAQMPDLFIPCDSDEVQGQAYVEIKFLLDLIESPARWGDEVVRHIEVTGDTGRIEVQQTPVFYITFNPGARLRIVTAQTFTWNRGEQNARVAAIDDVRAQVFAIKADVDLQTHPWRKPAAVTGERLVRVCEHVGFDLSPSGKKQYWPGRELTPVVDCLPHRFMVKVAYARYAIAKLVSPTGGGIE